jgi:hypothetical protein
MERETCKRPMYFEVVALLNIVSPARSNRSSPNDVTVEGQSWTIYKSTSAGFACTDYK